jgi:hypothetical protein
VLLVLIVLELAITVVAARQAEIETLKIGHGGTHGDRRGTAWFGEVGQTSEQATEVIVNLSRNSTRHELAYPSRDVTAYPVCLRTDLTTTA